MIWDDLVLKGEIDNKRMADALAQAFEVPREKVLVVDKLVPGMDVSSILILAERLACKGEFASRFCVAIRDNELGERLEPFEQKIVTLRRLCRTLDTVCLIGALGLDPFTVPLIQPTGDLLEAELDDDAEDDEFIILSSRPVGEKAA